jgi:hypothetical protein
VRVRGNEGGAQIGVTAGRLAATGGHGTATLTLATKVAGGGPAAFRLTFHYSTGVQPDPTGFAGCDRNDAGQTITCMVLAPPVNATLNYSFPFVIDPTQPSPQLSLAYAPDFWPEGRYVETVAIDVCNSC